MSPTGTGTAVCNGPSAADVERIAAIDDPVLRNLAITACYHQIASALARRYENGATWCVFSTWASRQAGATIRGEDLWETMKRHLTLPSEWSRPIESLWRKILGAGLFSPETPLGRVARAIDGPLDPFERASEAVSKGNLKVFAEIAPQFARYLAICQEGAPRDPGILTTFLQGFKEGEPPEGQDHLRRAFTAYYEAQYETDPAARGQLLFLANLEVGLHEQIRLQPQIAEALDKPVDEIRSLGLRLAGILLPAAALEYAAIRGPAAAILGALGLPLARFRHKISRRVITHCLMTISVPRDRVLRLGKKLELPVPASLREVTNTDLRRLLWLLDECSPGTADCGAEDWAELRDRMHFIMRFFRSFQEDPLLLESPFTPAQLTAILAGKLPEGAL